MVNQQRLPQCGWCAKNITGVPIGCPVRYNANRVYGNYRPVASAQPAGISIVQLVDDATFSIVSSPTAGSPVVGSPAASSIPVRFVCMENYETQGQFCGFPCALAYALKHEKHPLYTHAAVYLRQIYHKIYNRTPGYKPLVPANKV